MKTKLATVEHNHIAVSVWWNDDDGTWYYVLPPIITSGEAMTLRLLLDKTDEAVAQEAKHERT